MKGVLIVKYKTFKKTKVDITTTEEDQDKDLLLGEVTSNRKDSLFKKGQLVIFGKYATEIFKFEGEEFRFLREEDVIATKE